MYTLYGIPLGPGQEPLQREDNSLKNASFLIREPSNLYLGLGSSFNPIKKYFVVRAKLDQEDPRTIDIDIQETCLIVFSHRYKLRCYFPKPVEVNSLKSSYLKENDTMEIIIRQQ